MDRQNEEIVLLEKKAIEAALNESWQLAIQINEQILSLNSNNIPALNRLGMALSQSGLVTQAKQNFQKVIKLDSQNQIALKNINKLASLNPKNYLKNEAIGKKMVTFIEEPGKTKVVRLVRPAADEILAQLTYGQQVFIVTKKRSVCIVTSDKTYLGTIPDDLSSRLLTMIKGGNKYEVFVKSAEKQSLIIFIREVFRSKRFHNQPSFSASWTATMAYLQTEGGE